MVIKSLQMIWFNDRARVLSRTKTRTRVRPIKDRSEDKGDDHDNEDDHDADDMVLIERPIKDRSRSFIAKVNIQRRQLCHL